MAPTYGAGEPRMHDIVIVGGGSAGWALAARLSEMPGCSVLLIEAGKDVSLEAADRDILSNYPGRAYFNPDFTWRGQTAYLGRAGANDAADRKPARYEQARLLGGGSSINGLCANRGAPQDYDDWAAEGAAGWAWKDVQPYFRKLETDLDFSGDDHGKSGPVTIRRFPREDWSGFVRAAGAVIEDRGYQAIDDQNGAWRDGLMPASITVDGGDRRASCAFAYLTPAVRARPNLRILTETSVRRLLLEGRRAVGVELIGPDGAVSTLRAGEIIVSCGAIYSPALLMRSGIGPQADLAARGIATLVGREGVGRNLSDHPAISVSCYLRSSGRLWMADRHHTQAHLRYSSGVDGCPSGDMTLALLARSGWHALGQRIGSFYLFVTKAYSKGRVTLASADPAVPPTVDFRMLSDWRDKKRLVEGFRFIAGIALDERLDAVRSKSFPANYSDRVRKVSAPGPRNALLMQAFSTMLDWMPPFRGHLIDTLVTSGITVEDLLRDQAALENFIDMAVAGVWHPVGTCRMGDAADPLAVTDPAGKVHGVAGLRVCDASLMPSIPSANTNIPTIMIAERIADLVKFEQARAAA